MNSQQALQAIIDGDSAVVDQAGEVPPDIVAELDGALPRLEDDARRLAVRFLAAQDAPGTGALLLKFAAVDDLMIAASAVEALFRVPAPPPVEDTLRAAPKLGDDFLRGRLYLLAGKTGKPADLPRLRAATATERARGAARDAQVAAARLGGKDERLAFLDRVRQARAEEALDIGEQLAYVGDLRLFAGLVPWLSSTDPVMRLGNDSHDRMARMCDMAVWIARQNGVSVPDAPAELVPYDAAVLARAEDVLAALAD